MKKLLILGGNEKSIGVIEKAKERGYYTILCDQDENVITRKMVDKFYPVSVMDEEEVYKVAVNEKVDGIVSYASDRIALVVAKLANRLNLPSNPWKSVEILIKKDLFRKFLKDNNFNVPKAVSFTELNEDIKDEINKMKFPVMVKPTDSAGSTGVEKIEDIDELEKAFNNAIVNSQSQKVILEEYIEMDHECMIAGDAFVYNGKVEVYGLLNSHRKIKQHPFIPTGTSYPFQLKDKENEVKETVQRLVDILKIKQGPLNLELMYNKQGKLYIIEIAPRNGGNKIPEFINKVMGVDLLDALVATSVGDEPILKLHINYDYATTYVLHSLKEGIFNGLEVSDEIKENIIDKSMYIEKGKKVKSFDRANKAIGILFLKFDTQDEEKEKLEKMEELVKIKLDG